MWALLICAGFVYCHCKGRWAVYCNTHGKDSSAYRKGLLYRSYHYPYFYCALCSNTQKACPKLRWVCDAFVDFTRSSHFAINSRLIDRKMPLYMFPLVQTPNSNFSSLLDGLGTCVQTSVNISPRQPNQVFTPLQSITHAHVHGTQGDKKPDYDGNH